MLLSEDKNMTVKAIIFDFDGVITESMDIKTQAFAYLFKDCKKEVVGKIIKLHLDNGGMSRYEKFKIIYKDYLNETLTKDEEKRLGESFSEFCYEKMLECPYVKGVERFLENNYKKYKLFIASGTPHEEMNKIVDERGLRKYFQGVWGSPKSKSEISKMILEKYNLKNDEIVFVGDAPTDYWGAEEAKIGFIARIIPGEYNPFGTGEFKIKHIIGDLTSLDKTLNTIVNWVF